MEDHALSPEQHAMERRFVLPYNWLKAGHTRHVRQKNGIWALAHSRAGDIRGARVLDAGCGDGWYTAKMVTAGARACGIDYSERAIDFARLIVRDAEFKAASILDIPYPDATFDVVFSFQVLEHLPPADVARAAQELARVTKKGGKIIVSVPSVRRARSKAHYQHFTEASLLAAFKPYVATALVAGQERRTPIFHAIERVLENRVYTLERAAAWFNRSVYMKKFNETTPARGDNLMLVAER